ncbi:hypothetical protein PRZ48_008964 [Zasmidium cellare]|uniref:2EXR domain-containing protein n=1 Tax=Zasmidium cellare TaxID=395010 RepID=A0ABR0EHD4_ZASCE|nr:hypothetical protein PRZ48_008964 [Zasmidium cellare]
MATSHTMMRRYIPKIQKRAIAQQAKKAAEHNETNVPLFRLPGEVRNEIFQLALPTYVDFTTATDKKFLSVLGHDKTHHVQIPGLLSTCRQARQEASGYFYAQNSFFFYSNLDAAQIDELATYKIPKTLKELPPGLARHAKELHIIVSFGIKKCKHMDATRFKLKHFGELHFIMKGDQFALHGIWHCCLDKSNEVGVVECADEMAEVVDNYSQAVKCLVMGKIKTSERNHEVDDAGKEEGGVEGKQKGGDEASETKQEGDQEGRTLVRVSRSELRPPMTLARYPFWLTYESEDYESENYEAEHYSA